MGSALKGKGLRSRLGRGGPGQLYIITVRPQGSSPPFLLTKTKEKEKKRTRSLVVSIFLVQIDTAPRKAPGESFVWSLLCLPRWPPTTEDAQCAFFDQGAPSRNFLFHAVPFALKTLFSNVLRRSRNMQI